jgi:hypothetical protein
MSGIDAPGHHEQASCHCEVQDAPSESMLWLLIVSFERNVGNISDMRCRQKQCFAFQCRGQFASADEKGQRRERIRVPPPTRLPLTSIQRGGRF